MNLKIFRVFRNFVRMSYGVSSISGGINIITQRKTFFLYTYLSYRVYKRIIGEKD